MTFRYTDDDRRQISREAEGKTIGSLEWEPDGPGGGYWVCTFTDETEISFRLMAELGAGERIEQLARRIQVASRFQVDANAASVLRDSARELADLVLEQGVADPPSMKGGA
ncbi:MAG TPA: hypothetical protein VK989_13265 [Polyangia bacterium]|jgi:hypothetical protein|nr:hypothetical protein [Polyangia bacterium]